jgi:60 kDa SS-A/Ro ribonucleoprotein
MPSSRDALAGINALKTPQSQPIPGRTDMVKNEAGGYVFERDPMQKLEDFIILGTTGGSFHVGEDKLTLDNANMVFDQVNGNGVNVLRKAADISTATPPRAPSNRGALFAVAAVSALGDLEGRQLVKVILPQVARTTEHLATFFGYRKQLRGSQGGRAYHSALQAWLIGADLNDAAFRACKYRQRKTPSGEDMSIRDVIRIAHPRGMTTEQQVLLSWLAGTTTDENASLHFPAVMSWCKAREVKTPAEAIRVIEQLRVPWEFLPSEVLSDPGVWDALCETTGLTAVLRNLARMTRNGALRPMSPALSTITSRLTDPSALAKARIHPLNVYLTMRVYASGSSQPDHRKPAQTWQPVSGVLDVLEEAYELSFGYVQPSGRKLLITVDSSGSMDQWSVSMNGSDLGRAYDVANAMALTLLRIEKGNAHVIDVDTVVHPSRLTARTRLAETASWRPSGGGTDMSLPMDYALREKLDVDGFVIISDNETWYGNAHPLQTLTAYRKARNPDARVAVATMAPNRWSVLDPQDPGVLSVAGMDAKLPMAVTGFIRGRGA